jgi:2-dehydropantoate 2-reductase
MLCKSKENVYIIGKGETLNSIKDNGITLESEVDGNFVVFPTLATENTYEAGIMDIIFVCVKGYSLKAAARAISPMVGDHTIIIPIINGVNGGSKLYSYLERGKVTEAVMYISAKVEASGVIKHTSKNTRIVISSNKNRPIHKRYLEKVYNVLTKANIMCEVRKDAEVAAWNKYVFNCAFNVTDSYYDVKVKGILEDRMKFETFCNVVKECEEVGRSKGINISKDIYENSISALKNLSRKSISSMHRDVASGKKFELELFCGDLCRMGKDVGVPTPYTQKAYDKLKILQPM